MKAAREFKAGDLIVTTNKLELSKVPVGSIGCVIRASNVCIGDHRVFFSKLHDYIYCNAGEIRAFYSPLTEELK